MKTISRDTASTRTSAMEKDKAATCEWEGKDG